MISVSVCGKMAKIPVLLLLVIFSQAFGNPVGSEYDVIVVGLGASGTAAASTLAQAGKRVLALEAQDYIGGRVKTIQFGPGIAEEGAEWIHGVTNSTTMALAEANGVEILEQVLDMHAYRSDGAQFDGAILKDLVQYGLDVQETPPSEPEPVGQFITRKTRDYVKEKYPQLLNDTDFMDHYFFFMDQVLQGYDASGNWNEVTTASQYFDLEGSQDMSWHTNGYKTLFSILLNRYKRDEGWPTLIIKLNTEVTNIKWSPEGSDVVVTTADGKTFTAPHVIVTVSLGVLKAKYKTLFTPELPKEKEEAIQRVSFGVCSKVLLRYEHNWWGSPAIFSFIWRGEDKSSYSEEDQFLTYMDGFAPTMANNYTIAVWYCGESAKKIEVTPDDILKHKITDLIRRFIGKEYDVPEALELKKSTWYTNPYTRGIYSFDNLQTPQHPHDRTTLGAPLTDSVGVPRVLFAGEATSTDHFSTVHGALDTGIREARRLLGFWQNA